MTSINASEQTLHYQYGSPIIGLMMAVSCIVFIEPAPYDLLGVILFLILFALGMSIPRGISLPLGFLALFLLGNFIAAGFSDNPSDTLKSLAIRIYMVTIWLLLVCFIYQNPTRTLPVIWKGYIVAAIVAITLGVSAYYGLIHYPQFLAFGGTRVQGPFKDPNVYGPFLVPVAMYLIVKMENASGSHLLILIGLFFFIAFGILMGFSRGSWGNMVLSLMFFVGMRAIVSMHRPTTGSIRTLVLSSILIGIATLAIAWAVTSPNNPIGRMLQHRAKIQNYDVQDRFVAHKNAQQLALTTPIGIGPAQTPYFLGMEVHNVYLQIAMEAGWIGAIGFYCFLIVTVWKTFWFCLQPSEHQPLVTAMLGCLLGIIIQSYFIDSAHWRHFYLVTAIIWAIMLSEQNKPQGQALI